MTFGDERPVKEDLKHIVHYASRYQYFPFNLALSLLTMLYKCVEAELQLRPSRPKRAKISSAKAHYYAIRQDHD